MSPQTSRYPMPAAGDAAEPGGRHRRPESLADVVRPAPSAARPTFARPTAQSHPSRVGRHSTARHTSRPRSHRAPAGAALSRPQQGALLASLIAVAFLLIALPTTRGSDDGPADVDAINAAAQQAAVQNAGRPPVKKENDPERPAAPQGEQQRATDQPAKPGADVTPPPASPTAPPPSRAVVPPQAAGAAGKTPEKKAPKTGPGNSLRVTGSDVVSLTFDDGPDPVYTPKILALLEQHQVKAVFCVVGTQARRHPQIMRDIVAAGHTLCNHTWDHSLTIGKDKPGKIMEDLDRTNEAIRAAVPDAKIPFFRAPGGNFTDRLVTVAGGAGMTSLYWEVDPRDWERGDDETDEQHVARMVRDVRAQTRPGSIVLSHDFNQPNTITAYEKLLPWLTEKFKLGIPEEVTVTPPSAPPASGEPVSGAPAI